jgi:hypothetical protein
VPTATQILTAGILLLLGLESAVPAAPGDPVGAEFQVNTYTTDRQSDPAVAPDPMGGFVVVWESPGSAGDADRNAVLARRFDAAGVPVGAEFQVNTWTTGDQFSAAVAANGSQGFIVVWQSNGGSPGTDTDGNSVQGQLLDATGSPLGGEFQVNTYTTEFQGIPALTALADGFVVVWQSRGSSATDTDDSIQGQRFDAAGAPVGGEFQVNTYTSGLQRDPGVAPLGGGGFVVVWASAGGGGTDTSGNSVQAQRFDATGAPVGGEFQVNAYTNSDQDFPGVIADGAGGFVAQWRSAGSFGTDTSNDSIQVRRFDSQGVPQGADFQVNTYTTGSQFGYIAGPDGTGGFVVVWESSASGGTDTGSYSIQARRFDAAWQPVADQFQVNTYTTEGQNQPGVALDGSGGFVVVWRSGDSYGDILAQRFEGTSVATTTTTILVPGEALDGRKLALTTKPGHADKSKLAVLAKDAGLTLGRGNQSVDDPVVHGGALTISSDAGGFDVTHDLVGGWRYVGKAGQGRGYKWKSKSAPIRTILLKPGKLAIAGKGAGLGFDLDDDPDPVRVELTVGAHTYCLEFGGASPKFKAGRLYRATAAAAPAACP